MNLPQGQHYGLIAQEVEKVLPGLIKEATFDIDRAVPSPSKSFNPKNSNADPNTTEKKTGEVIDFKTINYTELIPVIIKGMQEQQETISKQQQIIDKQQQQIDELKTMVQSLTGSKSASEIANNAILSNATLEQNVPNPLSNTTSIRYNIPLNAGNAIIAISNNNGKTLKQISLHAGSGSITVDASTLSSGAYSYTLIINNKTIATRKMIVAR